MKVLFIGGTGLISQAASRLAVERGIELYLLNRGHRGEFLPEGARSIVADRKDEKAVAAALKGRDFDAVVNWIAYTPDQAASDAALFAGRTGQYLFISSASAYQKPAADYVITESTPLANPYWQYSRDKIACEEILTKAYRDSGFPITIVRPSLTYGPTMIPAGVMSWNFPWTLPDRMMRGKRIIVQGDGTSLWTMTHHEDFAKGFLGLLGNVRALGHAFHITSDEVLTWDQIVGAIGAAAGARPDIVHVSSDFISAIAPEEMGGLIGDKAQCGIFDNSKIKRFVPDFTATIPFAEGMRRSVKWYRDHPERCVVDEAFNALSDRIIAGYDEGIRHARG
jgi:nucleoside-diphosphate-sugar epimerase